MSTLYAGRFVVVRIRCMSVVNFKEGANCVFPLPILFYSLCGQFQCHMTWGLARLRAGRRWEGVGEEEGLEEQRKGCSGSKVP